MMRGIRRFVICAAVTGLLAAGAVGATMEVAHANFADLCQATSSPWTCTPELTATVNDVSAITVIVTDNDATTTNNVTENVVVNWQVSCTDGTNGMEATASAPTVPTPATVNLTLPITADGQCNVTASVTLAGGAAQPDPSTFTPTPYTAQLDYTPAASPTATATPTPTTTSSSSAPPVHPIKGFDGKCVSDNGNSSANRTKIIIWPCSGTDQAENWTFDNSNGEFKHNGKCMNDQGNGGIRSKVILWSCNGASNEKWNELSNGEIRLVSHGGTLCLDDPRSSTTNGTQLIVYTCKDSANQKWSLP
jgi:hypothetical protein